MKFIVTVMLLCTTAISLYAETPNVQNAIDNCQNRCSTINEKCMSKCDRPHTSKEEKRACTYECGKNSAECNQRCIIDIREHGSTYTECIRNAKTAKEKAACRQQYHEHMDK